MRWWCWHRWTKWVDETYTNTPIFGNPGEVAMQERRCTKCNKLRVRRVADK